MEKKSEVLEMLDDLFDKELYENDLKQTAFEEGEQIGEDALEESVQTIQNIIDTL